jgi:hypothetical protein
LPVVWFIASIRVISIVEGILQRLIGLISQRVIVKETA